MRTTFVVGLVFAMSGFAAAHPCHADPEVDTGETPVGRYYVDNEFCQPDCLFSIWVYQESNGEEGLQPHDEFEECGSFEDPYESDTIII